MQRKKVSGSQIDRYRGASAVDRESQAAATLSVATWREKPEPLQTHLALDFVRRDRHQDLS